MSNNFGKSWRLALGTVVATLMVDGEALACRAARSHTTIFFDQVPTRIGVQTIARVTITELIGILEYTLPDGREYAFTGFARIDKVIKGPIAPPRSRSWLPVRLAISHFSSDRPA